MESHVHRIHFTSPVCGQRFHQPAVLRCKVTIRHRKKQWYKSEKPQLTERELEVLRLYAQSLTIEQIAKKIFVAPDTVKYYRRKLFDVLEVTSIVQALSYATDSKMI